jgi:ATP-dependent Zn protease
MQNQNRSRMLLIIGGIWLAFLVFNFLSTNAAVKTIPYSEFLQLAKEGRVSEVAVSDNVIQGKMFTDNSDSEQGQPFQTVRVDGELNMPEKSSRIFLQIFCPGFFQYSCFSAYGFSLCDDFKNSKGDS